MDFRGGRAAHFPTLKRSNDGFVFRRGKDEAPGAGLVSTSSADDDRRRQPVDGLLTRKRMMERECDGETDLLESAQSSSKHAGAGSAIVCLPADMTCYDPCFVVSEGIPAQLDHLRLRAFCESLGLSEMRVYSGHVRYRGSSSASRRPVFVWAELRNHKFAAELYKVNCGIKNLLGNEKYIISRKDSLVAQMIAHGGQCHVAESFVCSRDLDSWLPRVSIAADDVFIFRPVESYGGQGISVLQNPTRSQITAAIDRGEESVQAIRHRGTAVLMSRYCRDPLLYNGRKCHFRAYFLALRTADGRLRTFLWEIGKILTAAQPYSYSDFGNAEIHDTHFKSTERDFLFPEDLDAGGASSKLYREVIRPQMEGAMRIVSRILLPHAKPFLESLHAFEVFGVDFLIHADGTVWLLEVNDKLAYTCHDQQFRRRFSADFFEWVGQCVLAPLVRGDTFPEPLFESLVADSEEGTNAAMSAAALASVSHVAEPEPA